MKKIIYALIFILVLSSCSLGKVNLSNDKCLIEYKTQDGMGKVLLDFGKVNNCNNNKTEISGNEAKVEINDDFTLNFIDGASFNINENKFYIIKRNSKIDNFITSIKKWVNLANVPYSESMLDIGGKVYENSNTYKLTIKIATLDNGKSRYMLVLGFEKFIIITFLDIEEPNYEGAYEPDYGDENSIDMKTLKIEELFKKVDDLIPDEIVKNEESNNNLSEENLLNNGYKLNKLGNVKEFYKEEIEDVDIGGGQYREFVTYKTIYIKGNKTLIFSIENLRGILNQLNIEHSNGLVSRIDLSEYSLYPEVGQPIFGKIPYKVIVNKNLDEIRIVNKNKGINKVIWKE